MRPERFDKIDLTPKKHHGYSVVLFILGTLFPPLAVAARFGFGSDFAINLVLTLCGYFPGHGHNFYIQNVRNNKNHARTPKWAIRYGLIDDTAMKRRQKRSQWATRYDERLPESTHVGQEYAEGQVPDREDSHDSAQRQRDELWDRGEEGFYGQPAAAASTASTAQSGGGRWHYPANFDDTVPPTPTGSKKKSRIGKKDKKDRWARTEDAYADPQPKKKKRSKASRTNSDIYNEAPDSRSSIGDVHDGPEDAVGGLYGPGRTNQENPEQVRKREEDEGLTHEF